MLNKNDVKQNERKSVKLNVILK